MQPIFLKAILIPTLPLLAFLVIIAFTRQNRILSSLFSIAMISVSLVLSIDLFFAVAGGTAGAEWSVPWLTLGSLRISLGVLVNQLTVVMLLVVTGISLLVQIYSMGYMKDDEQYSKFFAFIALFSFSMLGLVVANGFIQLYIFWELVGLCSYLLIGFWYEKPSAAQAAKKAFIVTRFGDFGFLIGIIILCSTTGTFNFLETEQAVKAGTLGLPLITLVSILLFCGAIGKSGQFPLHVWLPDAMEGPTPVSALIQAATMVAAGVFMVARLYVIFSASATALMVVAFIGGFTALFAATIALVQDDFKKILAYSTVSQLGYMLLALGVGGYTAGTFHLVTHAAFKALLFLCAGSVIHAVVHNNIWEMGGLWKKMPITAITFLIAALSISGIFPFAGFWSKDAIIISALASGNRLLYYSSLVTAFLTAFYMFRIFFLVFTGKDREGIHAHESPATMTVPLLILAFFSVFLGLIGSPIWPHNIYSFIYFGAPRIEGMNISVAVISNIVALSGILLSFLVYGVKVINADALRKGTGPFYTLLKNKYYVDEFYMFLVLHVVFGISYLFSWIDRHIVDRTVNLAAESCHWAGSQLRLTITGKVQNYALAVFCGGLLVIVGLIIFNPVVFGMFGGK